MGEALEIIGLLSHKWFDELSRFIELFLCTDSDGMVFGLTSNLPCIFEICFVLILSMWLTIKPNDLNFIHKFLKNMIKLPSLHKESYKISSVDLSICLSVCDRFFSGSTQWMFLIFCMRIYTKKWQSQILEICICFLDNWVNKTNFNKNSILMGATLLVVLQMMPHNWLYGFVKIACLGKIWLSLFRPKCSPPIRLQDFLNFNISKMV